MTHRTDRLAKNKSKAGSSQGSQPRDNRQPTPPPPPPPADPEQPRAIYRNREFVQEFDWQERELRGASLTQFGWRVIDQNKLNPLLVPAGRAFERLTALFYQNMSLDDNEEKLTVRIDGWGASFTKEDLAHALGIPASAADTELPACPPDEFPKSHEDCRPFLNVLYPIEFQNEVPRRTSLMQEMWFFDSFLTRQLYPLGHKAEKRPPLPKCLWLVQKGFFLDAAQLIFNTMWRVHQSEFTASRKKPACSLPYMRYIHTLLLYLGYPVRPEELFYAEKPQFTLTLWRQSLRKCRAVLNIPETDDEDEVKHMKWTKFYAALPQHTPPNFRPWVPHAQRPPVQDTQSQVQQQGDDSQEPIADWDGILLPPRVDRRRKRRAVAGEGSSAAAGGEDDQEAGASRADIEQILRGVQGLQLGFNNFSPSLTQRVDDMYGRVENVELQVQGLRTDFTHYREQADARYQEFHTYHDQQTAWQQQFQQQQTAWQQQFQEQQTDWQRQFEQQNQLSYEGIGEQMEANFEALNGNFYEMRHYEREILRRHMTPQQLEEFQSQAEAVRDQQYWNVTRPRPPAGPDEDDL